MFHRTAPQAIWDIYMLSVTSLAVWRGGWAERAIAFGMVASSIASALVQDQHNLSAIQWGILAADSLYLALIFWVALRSEWLWPLFPAAFQLITVIVYAARMADRRVGARASFVTEEIFSYLILLAVAVSVWQRARRRGAGLSPPSTSTGTSAT